jgi:galactitol-specific phosphotransferase system IIB component
MVSNDPDWVRVYSTTQPHKIEIVKAVLEDNQISAVEVNRKDSAYTFMGEIDLYVQSKDVVLAQFLIKNNEL